MELNKYEIRVLCLIAVADKGPRYEGERLYSEEELARAADINGVLNDHYVNYQQVTATVNKLIDAGLVEVVGQSPNGRILGINPEKYYAWWREERQRRDFERRQLEIQFGK